MSKAEEKYLGRIVRFGCIVCKYYCDMFDEVYEPPDEKLQLTVIHHVRTGQGKSQRAPDYLTVPLCVNDHVGTHGIHGDKQRIKAVKLTEMDLLGLTIKQYTQTYGA